MTVYVVGYKDKIPEDAIIVESTSRSKNWSKGLSPFFVGPVEVWPGQTAKNVENAWQFSKVYSKFNLGSSDFSYYPSPDYFLWASKGFEDDYAHRYPMGRGMIPLYSVKYANTNDFNPNIPNLFQAVIGTTWRIFKKLNYIEARKELYIPFYAEAVIKTEAFKNLEDLLFENPAKDLYILDFDGYNSKVLGMTYDEVINCENRKMGHGFVLAMLLDGFLDKLNYV